MRTTQIQSERESNENPLTPRKPQQTIRRQGIRVLVGAHKEHQRRLCDERSCNPGTSIQRGAEDGGRIMNRQPIRWNRDALEALQETALGVLILVVMPLSALVIAASIGSMQ